MSLNWREIDHVLQELSLPDYHIQQVYQPDFRNLVLELYRPGTRMFLLVSFEQGRCRLHRTTRTPRKSRKVQRFEAFLKSRIRGGRITAADQPGGERVVRIVVERASEQTILWLRLWGGAANLIVTDTAYSILDCFFRRPKRGEVSGGTFDPSFLQNSDAAQNEKKQRFSVRDHSGSNGLNEFLDTTYTEESRQETTEQLRAECTARIQRRQASLQARLDDIERGMQRAENADTYRHHANLILSSLHRIPSSADSLVTEDWDNNGSRITIPLDPTLTGPDNAQVLFRKAQRAEESLRELGETRDELLSVLHDLQQKLEIVEHSDSLRELSDIKAAVAPSSLDSTEPARKTIPGLQFQSSGFTLLVGRNARENDALLRHHVRGNDLWLHTRDYPGGYVFILHRNRKSPPLETLIDAGHLAVHYSQAHSETRVDLYYTQVKYLRRTRDASIGTVLPTQEKNFEVRMEPERLGKLLSQQSRY